MEVAEDSQTLAAAVNHASLNLGNSLGAYLGGVVIAGGYGYLAPTWVGLALCVPAVILVVLSIYIAARTRAGSHGGADLRLQKDAVLDGSLS
jgi:DHA1 family inner membrane transport protein